MRHIMKIGKFLSTAQRSKSLAQAINQHFLREALINSANEMTHEAHGTQQSRHINKIGEEASAAQRSDSLDNQLINVSLVIVYPMTDHYARCIKYECFNNERARRIT